MKDLEDIPLIETRELLLATMSPLAHPTPTHPKEHLINIDITKKDFHQMFCKWKESTTTSPSGRHLGHYKAILETPELIEFHCIMASLPIKFGFAPDRWKKAIQIMLEKKTGNPLLHRLRGIIIVEADYNWVLRLIWKKRFFRQAAQHGNLMTVQQA